MRCWLYASGLKAEWQKHDQTGVGFNNGASTGSNKTEYKESNILLIYKPCTGYQYKIV